MHNDIFSFYNKEEIITKLKSLYLLQPVQPKVWDGNQWILALDVPAGSQEENPLPLVLGPFMKKLKWGYT